MILTFSQFYYVHNVRKYVKESVDVANKNTINFIMVRIITESRLDTGMYRNKIKQNR